MLVPKIRRFVDLAVKKKELKSKVANLKKTC